MVEPEVRDGEAHLVGCNDCLLHLEHHVLRESCVEAIIEFLDANYDKPDQGISRVERYYTEYESRLLGSLVEGSDVCGVSEP